MTLAIRSDAPAPVLVSQAPLSPPAEGDPSRLEPGAFSADALTDVISALYASMARLRDIDLQAGRLRVDENTKMRDKALADEQAALERVQANQSDSGDGFFSSVGKLVGDVVDDAMHARFEDAAGDAGSDVVAAWNSPKFWSDLETGLKDVALVSDAVAEAAMEIGGPPGEAVAAAAAGVSVWATASAALAHARGEHFAAEAQDAQADATRARHGIEKLNRIMKWMLSELKATDKSHQRALLSAQNAMRTADETFLATAALTMRG